MAGGARTPTSSAIAVEDNLKLKSGRYSDSPKSSTAEDGPIGDKYVYCKDEPAKCNGVE